MGSTDKDFLKATEEKVKAIEDRRPGYDPENLDSLTHTITWTLSVLMNYDELDHVIYSTLAEYRQKGEPEPEDLQEKLYDVRRKRENILRLSNTAWRDFETLTDKIKAEDKARAEREKHELEAQRNYLFSGNDPFVPLLNGELTNIIFNLDLKDFDLDPYSNTATCKRDGVEIKITNYTEFIGQLSTSPLKIFDAAIAYLTTNNYYSAKNSINSTVEIPFTQYAKTRGRDFTPRKMKTKAEQQKENRRIIERKKDFKKELERDLDNLSKFTVTAKVKRGKNAGDYRNVRFISSHSITNDTIRITFDPITAKYLVNSYIMSYAPQLQTLDDRNPNLYRIGRKMLLQSSIDNNNAKGTQNTLKVKTIIASTSAIPTPEELQQQGKRDWRARTKGQLEKALNGIRESGLVTKWEYEDPKTKKTYKPDKLPGKISANDYMNLNVNFSLIDNPDQIARGIRKAEEKAAISKK